MKRIICYLFFVLASLASIVSSGVEANKVEGTFTVNGKTVRLANIYTFPAPNPFDATKKDICLLMSDNPIPQKTLDEFKKERSTFTIKDLSNEGKVHLIYLQVDEEKSFVRRDFFHDGIKGGYASFADPCLKLEVKTFNTEILEGKSFTESPCDFFGSKIEYNATFRVSVSR